MTRPDFSQPPYEQNPDFKKDLLAFIKTVYVFGEAALDIDDLMTNPDYYLLRTIWFQAMAYCNLIHQAGAVGGRFQKGETWANQADAFMCGGMTIDAETADRMRRHVLALIEQTVAQETH